MSMNLYKNPEYGTYSIRLERSAKHPNGKLVSLKAIIGHSVKDPDEAQEIFDTIQKEHLEDKLEQLAGVSRIRISQLSKEYTRDADRLTLAAATLRMDQLALKTLTDTITDKMVRLVNQRDFKKLKSILLSRKLSHHTINTYRRHILAAFNYAVENEYIKKVPKFPPIKTGDHQPRILTQPEIKKILKYAKKNDFEMWRYILYSLWTGCRREEIINLQYQHISGDRALVTGKNDKQRTIRLLPGAFEAMGELLDVGPIFNQWHKDTITHRFKKIARKCKIEDIHFHNCRHSAATYMIESGMHPKAVQATLGHADFRTTEKYINIRNQFMYDEMEKFKI